MNWRTTLQHRAGEVRGLRIWITGASSGIGAALALLLAQQGNQVIISARSADKLDAVRKLAPQQIECLVCDVADKASMQRAGAALKQRFGSIDILVINAGICEYIDVAPGAVAVDAAVMHRVFDVNFFGAVAAVNAALPLLRVSAAARKTPALIIGVSSLSTYTAFARAQAYGASKAALRYFLEAMRIDLAREQIDVTLISPGFVDTPLTAQNDFPMPTKIDTQRAAREIAGAMAARVLEHAFPFSLACILKIARGLPSVWFRFVAPRLARQASTTQPHKNIYSDNDKNSHKGNQE